MATHNLAKVMMALGALDDLAEIVENGKGINVQTMPKRIRICTDAIKEALIAENKTVMADPLAYDIFLKSRANG